jgi:hypothetical protein
VDRITSGGIQLPAGAMAGPGSRGGGGIRLGRNPNETVLTPAQVEEMKQARADQGAVESAPKGKRLSLRVKTTPEVLQSEMRIDGLRPQETGGGDALSRKQSARSGHLRLRALSRDGSDDQAQPQTASGAGSDAPLASALAEKGFVLSMQFFREGDLDKVQAGLSELVREREIIEKIVDRRLTAKKEERCSYCNKKFTGYDNYNGRTIYREDGIIKALFTCRNPNCVTKWNDDSEKLHNARMAL